MAKWNIFVFIWILKDYKGKTLWHSSELTLEAQGNIAEVKVTIVHAFETHWSYISSSREEVSRIAGVFNRVVKGNRYSIPRWVHVLKAWRIVAFGPHAFYSLKMWDVLVRSYGSIPRADICFKQSAMRKRALSCTCLLHDNECNPVIYKYLVWGPSSIPLTLFFVCTDLLPLHAIHSGCFIAKVGGLNVKRSFSKLVWLPKHQAARGWRARRVWAMPLCINKAWERKLS